MAPFTLFLSFLLPLLQVVLCFPTYTPVQPPSYPLAVKNPYLSAWVPGNQVKTLPSASAQFWNGLNLTWSVIARVNDQAYSLFGVPAPGSGVEAAIVDKAEYTATHSTFTLTAGQAAIVLDFFSPISPANLTRQSAPYSYLTVSATPIATATPNISVYTDIDNSWIGQIDKGTLQLSWRWSLIDGNTAAFSVRPGGVDEYTEVQDTAQWGAAVYCGRSAADMPLSRAVGAVEDVRANFVANGTLAGSISKWVANGVVAYSQNLGKITGSTNVTFAIGYLRSPAIYYDGKAQATYYEATCSTPECGCTAVLDDFPAADAESRQLDIQISSKAEDAGGANYSDIVTLSARQAFGTIDITIDDATLDTRDVLIFVKEISSDGNVNTIDVMYPLSPILYVMAPEYIRMMLEPNLRYLAKNIWPYPFVMHDLGSGYPNATGHEDGHAEYMPIESDSDLLTLAHMYSTATGDKQWVAQYASLFRTYADDLVNHGLYTESQLSSDDFLGVTANQTGLAVKAAIALNAYGLMTGQSNYSDLGRQRAKALYEDRLGTDSKQTHFTCVYGEEDSWGLQYNLFQDVLLNLQTFPKEAYEMQTDYYPAVRMEAGVPLTKSTQWSKTDWMLFSAATAMAPGVDNKIVRDMFIDDVHAFMSNGLNPVPFGDKFLVQGNSTSPAGAWVDFRNRPVVGGHFAVLALGGAKQINLDGY
ncbi:hypothetical protein LTR86_001093 [Recurvomyces mirabilis]|nr:hypothetical protein LTR86_001093 [Recurvomyces mirabilis]